MVVVVGALIIDLNVWLIVSDLRGAITLHSLEAGEVLDDTSVNGVKSYPIPGQDCSREIPALIVCTWTYLDGIVVVVFDHGTLAIWN